LKGEFEKRTVNEESQCSFANTVVLHLQGLQDVPQLPEAMMCWTLYILCFFLYKHSCIGQPRTNHPLTKDSPKTPPTGFPDFSSTSKLSTFHPCKPSTQSHSPKRLLYLEFMKPYDLFNNYAVPWFIPCNMFFNLSTSTKSVLVLCLCSSSLIAGNVPLYHHPVLGIK
jgi:hypothetical protein